MSVPVLYSINAFDATTEFTFTFGWDGNQSIKNRLRIFDNVTNALLYDAVIVTFQLKHTLPINSITNGLTCWAEIYTIDSNEVQSSPSNKIIFKTYSTPTWNFSNLITNQIIENSSYLLELNYSQSEGETLNYYQIFLYSATQSLLYQSGVLYDRVNLTSSISGLEDNTQYYIRATGKTLNGMDLDTGFIPISVEYTSPSIYSLLTLENVAKDATIKISYNLKIVTGTSNVETPTYIDGTKIDLTTNGDYVNFEKGFLISGNFLLQMVGQDFIDNSIIAELSNEKQKIELKYMRGEFTSQVEEKAYFILRSFNNINNYVIYSNYIPLPLPTDRIHIWIKRVDNVYDLQCEILI